MKLDAARLCLDCEDVHDGQVCPSCGSEAFAFLTRWVKPSVESRPRPQPSEPASAPLAPQARTPEQIDAFRQLIEGKPAASISRGLLTKGVVGLAALSLIGWAWRTTATKRREQGPQSRDSA
jgi:hypothetical protein